MVRLMFTLLLFCSSFSFGQVKEISYKNQIGVYNEYTGEFDWGKSKIAPINFTIIGSVVTCYDAVSSVYRLIESSKKEFNIEHALGTVWDCFDEMNRICTFRIYVMKDDGQLIFHITYENNIAFRYYIRLKTNN